MANDPIREALRAAERAIARSMHAAGMPAALGEDQWHEEAAAAVAAFLRALPDSLPKAVHFSGVATVRTTMDLTRVKEMADAVERQARAGRG